MRKYRNVNPNTKDSVLYLGLSDIGRITESNANLNYIKETFPNSWSSFQEDIKNSNYLNAGLIIYNDKDREGVDVAFVPAYDRYCDSATITYIFQILKKVMRRTAKSYFEIVIPEIGLLKPEFVTRFDVSFPGVFEDYKQIKSGS